MNIEYRIDGMTCGHCEMTVEEVFSDNGFQAKADRARNIVTLDYDISEDSLIKIKDNLFEGGYSLGNKVNS